MTTISEAITTIKKAENDADKLIEDTEKKSSEMIDESDPNQRRLLKNQRKKLRRS